jgi:hypothetical protein
MDKRKAFVTFSNGQQYVAEFNSRDFKPYNFEGEAIQLNKLDGSPLEA